MPQTDGQRPGADRATRIPIGDPAWAAFVAGAPDATAFHTPQWARLIADTYGFRASAMAATGAQGGITAGVPFIEVGARRRHTTWLTLPFTDHCPILGDAASAASAAVVAALRAGAECDARVRSVDIRADVPTQPGTKFAVRHTLDLSGDVDAVRAGLSARARRSVRRGIAHGVQVHRADSERDLTEHFYRLHVSTRHRQGVPVQPRRFFASLWREIVAEGLGSVLIAEHGGRPVAGAVMLQHNRTTVYKYAASDRAAWSLNPNHVLCWRAITDAVEAGSSVFDFGRSDLHNAGLREFKSSWGAVELDLVHTRLYGPPAQARGEGTGPAARIGGRLLRSGPQWLTRCSGELLYRFAA